MMYKQKKVFLVSYECFSRELQLKCHLTPHLLQWPAFKLVTPPSPGDSVERTQLSVFANGNTARHD